MLLLSLVACLPLGHCITQQETTLNAQSSTKDGASISRNPSSVSTSGPNYNIHVQSQDAYDLKLSLDNSWGFHSSTNSTITLTLDGSTPFPDDDADLLFVFSVNDFQYFSFFLHLDTNNLKSRIYPSVTMAKNTQPVSQWITDRSVISQRWHRVSNNDQWIVLHEWREQALWPLTFVISNEPLQHQSVFQFYHNAIPSLAVQYAFDAAFVEHQPIDIYILGDSKHEEYTVSSAHIVLSAPLRIPTPLPTNTPTHISTKIPTFNPIKPTTNSVTAATTTKRPTRSPITTTTRRTTSTTATPTKRSVITNTPTKPVTRSPITSRTPTEGVLTATVATTKRLNLNTFVFNDTNIIQMVLSDADTERNNGYLVVFVTMVGCAVAAVLFQFCRLIRHRRKRKLDEKEEDKVAPAMIHDIHHESVKSDCDKATEKESIDIDINDGDMHKEMAQRGDTEAGANGVSEKYGDIDMSSTAEPFEFAMHGRRTEFIHAKNDSDLTFTSKRGVRTSSVYRKETDKTESVFYERIHRPYTYDYEGKYEETVTDADIENTTVTCTQTGTERTVITGRRYTNGTNGGYFMGSPTINRYWNNHIKVESMPTVEDTDFVVEHSVSSLF